MKIYTYIYHVNLKGAHLLFSIHIFIQYGIICPFAQFPTFIHFSIIRRFKYQKHLSKFNFYNIILIQKVSKSDHGVSCMHGRNFTFTPCGFDDDSALARSLLLNLFTWYLRDDKNALSIFMLNGSIQFSLHFILTQIIRLF